MIDVADQRPSVRVLTCVSLGALALVMIATGAAALMLTCDQQRTMAAPAAGVTPPGGVRPPGGVPSGGTSAGGTSAGGAPVGDTFAGGTPVGIAPGGPAPGGTPATTKIFGVIRPGGTPGQVLVARATEHRSGGPETLVPVRLRPYAAMRLAPGAVIRITAPLYPGSLTDWILGTQVTPEQFDAYARQAEAEYGPLPDRARMFHLWLDPQGRVSRMQHYFTP